MNCKVILEAVVGSTAHGLSVKAQDDTDFMGVYVEPPEAVCGPKRPEGSRVSRTAGEGKRSMPGDIDIVHYSLRHFLKLASAGNPTVLTLLWAPHCTTMTAEGELLRRERGLFVTKAAGPRFLGYLRSQIQGLVGSRGQRQDLVQMYGYDTKYAMHMLRLAHQGIEFLTRGELTLPMAEGPRMECRAVRLGQQTREWALERVEYLCAKLERVTVNSPLPKEPDRVLVGELAWKLHRMAWGL